MKISHLQEGSVAGDPSITQNAGDAPRFGRDPTVLEKSKKIDKVEEMTAGCVATVAAPVGKTQKRSNSIFSGIKTSSKYANSKKAGIYEDEISEENLVAKQKQEELFKKAKLRDLGKRRTISDVLHMKELEHAMLDEMSMMGESDNDFWYHGPHAVAQELHRIHNKHKITTEDIHQLWETRPPTHVSVINNKPFMEKPDVANILKAHKELIAELEEGQTSDMRNFFSTQQPLNTPAPIPIIGPNNGATVASVTRQGESVGEGSDQPASSKKFYTNKKQWQRDVDDVNHSVYDDESEYIGDTGRSTVTIKGREWARWSDAQQKGYIDMGSMSEQSVAEGETWSKHNHKRVGGMSDKSVKSYRRSHPGSKIQTAVTTKPSKLKKGSKSAKRRASFCARMKGMKKHRTGAKTARDPNSNINKSLRRWHCESIEDMQQLIMIAEQQINEAKNLKQQAAIAISKKQDVSEAVDQWYIVMRGNLDFHGKYHGKGDDVTGPLSKVQANAELHETHPYDTNWTIVPASAMQQSMTESSSPQVVAAKKALKNGLKKMPGSSPNMIQKLIHEIKPDGTIVVMNSSQATTIKSIKEILALGGGKQFDVVMAPPGSGWQSAKSVPVPDKEIDKQEVTEAKNDYVPPKEADYDDDYQDMVKRVGKKAQEQDAKKKQQEQSNKSGNSK